MERVNKTLVFVTLQNSSKNTLSVQFRTVGLQTPLPTTACGRKKQNGSVNETIMGFETQWNNKGAAWKTENKPR